MVSSLRSHGRKDSELTKKNAANRRKIAVDVTEMDKELSVEDREEVIEFDESEPEPAGIINAYHVKPQFNHQEAASDLSNTIEEIHQHNIRN